ncbi:MAG: sulfatase family protein [Opitutales bacterium]
MATATPNILWITSDQQHWNTIGKYFDEVKTPNLDRLADQGVFFKRAYCPNPTCTPTRASMITGQYPSTHGAWSLGTRLRDDADTLGGRLQAAGYDCSLIGKAHFQPLIGTEAYPSLESYPLLRDLDYWKAFHGPFYGFNHVELARNHADECHAGQHYALWMEEKGHKDWARHFRNTWGAFDFSEGKGVNPAQEHRWSIPEEIHYNTWITERSIARIDHCREAGQPFFIWASYFDPHPPYLVPEPWASMYDPAAITVPEVTPGEHDRNPPHFRKTQEPHPDFSDLQESGQPNHGCGSHLQDKTSLAKDIAIYYGMVSMLDHYVGKLLDHLDATGQAGNTLVVFTSDHGHYYGHHGLTKKGPFHYEDGVRVPFIARWPQRLPAGLESNALQTLVDLPTTTLKAAGLDIPLTMQGVNQLPVWQGEAPSARDHVLVENRHQPTAIHQRTYIDRWYKLTVYYRQPYGELFDLEGDPGEINNLWDDPDSQQLKADLIRCLLDAELGREPLHMPRIAPA